MAEIRFALPEDRDFWFRLDRHLPESAFEAKRRDGQAYVLLAEEDPAGLLRWNLFWDNTPFCCLLYVEPGHQRRGFGRLLMERWERDMRAGGHKLVLTSTQADESAQHFYRKLGYRDCGGLVLPGQSTELFLCKEL